MRGDRWSRRAAPFARTLLVGLALVVRAAGAVPPAEEKAPDPEAPGLNLAERSEALVGLLGTVEALHPDSIHHAIED